MKTIFPRQSTLCAAAILITLLICVSSCKKQDDWLNAKNINSDVTPSSLQDFQAMLDDNTLMNGQGSILGLAATDNLYIPEKSLDAGDQTIRNAYLWSTDIYNGKLATDWSGQYKVVEYGNIILEGLAKLSVNSGDPDYKNVKGSALFFRAYAFFQLCQLYCKAYNPATSKTDLGIPLRQTSDVNVKVQRSSLEEAYQLIIADLKSAVTMLPDVPLYRTRPSSVAANGLLAKIYLSMGQYDLALNAVNAALAKYNTLLNYNTLTISASNPFPTFAKGNPEIIFYAATYGLTAVVNNSAGYGRIDPALYLIYENGDLRKPLLYTADGTTGLYKYKGTYTASAYPFCGIATNELYLIKSECLARKGEMASSLVALNALLQNRYSAVGFIPFQTGDAQQLLARILLERRKEMPYNGNTRWDDLKRLNLDKQFQTTLTRQYHGTEYTLLPNDNKYVFPVPDDEVQLEGLIQNPR